MSKNIFLAAWIFFSIAALPPCVKAENQPHAEPDIINSEMSWDDFVSESCGTKRYQADKITSEECIRDFEQRRQRNSGSSPENTNNIKLSKIERFKIYPTTQEQLERSGRHFVASEVAYPQILNPENNAQRAWNKEIEERIQKAEKPACEGRRGEFHAHYKIAFASRNLISLLIETWRYCPGAPHGYDSAYFINRVLTNENKAVSATDIFNPESGWQDALAELSNASIKSQNYEFEIDKTRLKESLTAVSLWGISPAGLEIRFGAVNGYAAGRPVAYISWDKLKPYLKNEPTFDLPVK